MEEFDLYNNLGEKLHKTMIRGEGNQVGEYHKVVHIWIRRGKGDYLIQQRNKTTDKYPFQWAPTAGAITKGETMEEAAIRETNEEIGITLDKENLEHIGQYFVSNERANYIVEQFLVQQDIDLNSVKLDLSEVKQVMYASIKEIEDMTHKKEFWNFYEIDKNYLNHLERRSR